MPSYSNGNIPENLLVRFASGHNNTDGNWYHALSPATYARHQALVRAAKRRTGRDLAITSGWSAYRPYAAQVLARKIWGNGAATPGTSSHGGFWEGRQTLAMDYGNWDAVYAGKGGRDAFWEDCRSVGLTPGMIMKSRGYPDEPWHVIDLNPWSAVPSFADGGSATPLINSSEEEDMPINFFNGLTGVSYTMIPGVMIFAHANGFGGRMTNYINTGRWSNGEGKAERIAAGERDLNADHVTWMLPHYGFARLNAATLPKQGVVYSDWIDSSARKEDAIARGEISFNGGPEWIGGAIANQTKETLSAIEGVATPKLTDAQVLALADAIASKVKVGATASEIRAEFAKNPLK